jgi:hypothetical protein
MWHNYVVVARGVLLLQYKGIRLNLPYMGRGGGGVKAMHPGMVYATEMLLLLLAIVSVSLLPGFLCSIPVGDVEVLYVKPAEPSTECPSGDSPCHSLQYYANHSNFTSNRRFLFLEGEHHLDSVVSMSGVANLSLVGAIPGVTILCKSWPSGFCFKDFVNLNFKKMVIHNICSCSCFSYSNKASVNLLNGLEASLEGVTVTSTSYYSALMANNIEGFLSITNSRFTGDVQVMYSLCNRSSIFNLTTSAYDSGLRVESCGDLQVLIADTICAGGPYLSFVGVNTTQNSTITVKDTTVHGAWVVQLQCGNQCYNSIFIGFL